MGQIIPNKTYTALDGSVYRVEVDGSVTKIKGDRVQSNESPSKYQITPDGEIYRVESDGSVTYLGNAEKDVHRQISRPFLEKSKKKNHVWIWIGVLLIFWGILGSICVFTGYLYLSNSNAFDESSKTEDFIYCPEYVDLGLPSGLKWATCNVGASYPSDYGDYFAWGETTPKSEYTAENCKTWEKNLGDISGNPQYDAACANWGDSWRLPSEAECMELKDNCTWTWTSLDGYNGYEVTGPNGNSIFLPAAVWRDGSSLYYAGDYGSYWSSTPGEGDTQYACYLDFSSGYHSVNWSDRYIGRSVRPVSD